MSDLINTLIRSNNLVMWHDYRSRSLRDWSGNGNNGTAVNTPKWADGAVQFGDNSLQRLQVATGPTWNFTNFTFLALARRWRPAGGGYATFNACDIIHRVGPVTADFAWRLELSGVSSMFYLYDNTLARGLIYNNCGNNRLMAINGGDLSAAQLFADGVSVGTYGAANFNFNTNQVGNIGIGNNTAGALPTVLARLGLQAVLVVNRKLTATEHAQIYGELTNFNWESKPGKHAWRNVRPMNVTSSTIAQYDMIARNVTIPDVSGNGRHGTLTNYPSDQVVTPIGRALQTSDEFRGNVGGYLDTSITSAMLNNVADNCSVCCWHKRNHLWEPGGDEEGVITKGAAVGDQFGIFYLGNLNVCFYNQAGPDIITGPVLQNDNYHHVGWTYNPSTVSVQLYVDGEAYGAPLVLTALGASELNWLVNSSGKNSSRCFGGLTAAPQFIKAIQDATWWKEQYRNGAKAVQYRMGNGLEQSLVTSEGGTVGAYLSNSRWRFADANARYIIGLAQINGEWMKTIEGVGQSGYLYAFIEDMLGNDAPNHSYGTWEWWQWKPRSEEVRFSLVNLSTTTPAAGTYTAIASNANDARLTEQGVGNVYDLPNVFTGSIWQKVKLTRSYAGRWRLYLNDNLVTEATDNTSFTTTHWLLYLGSGCKIAGLTKYLGDISV